MRLVSMDAVDGSSDVILDVEFRRDPTWWERRRSITPASWRRLFIGRMASWRRYPGDLSSYCELWLREELYRLWRKHINNNVGANKGGNK